MTFFMVRNLRAALACGSMLALSACASLPVAGPTEDGILHPTNEAGGVAQTFPVTSITLENASSLTPPAGGVPATQLPDAGRSIDAIGAGDVLAVSLMSTGFLSAGTPAYTTGSGIAPATLLDAPVLVNGTIDVPFAGTVHVAGMDVHRAAAAITRRIQGQLDHPQVEVSFRTRDSSSVVVSGDVPHPGRHLLSADGETVADALAEAGGTSGALGGTSVSLERDGVTVQCPVDGAGASILLAPGDRIHVGHIHRTVTVLGAAAKVGEIPFGEDAPSLAEILARSGGPLDERADANAVFVFRGNGPKGAPQLFQLDLMQPASFFAAQRFTMRNGDTVYIANAKSMSTFKVLNLFSTVMSPAATAAYVAK